jgi:hypothetical protein
VGDDFMKRKAAIFLAIILLFAACGNGGDVNPESVHVEPELVVISTPDEPQSIFEEEDRFTSGRYFDSLLIDIIGVDEFMQWLGKTPYEERTVYRLIEYYGITNEELYKRLPISIYEEIMRYWPES